MSLLFNSISMETLSIIVAFATILIIYGIVDLEKKKPGHPFKYALISLDLTAISILVSRWVSQSPSVATYFDLFDKISTILTCICFLVLIVSTYLSYKRGYISEKGKQLLNSTLLPCVIVIVVCVLFITYVYFFW